MEEASKKDFANIPVVWEPKSGSGLRTKAFMKKIEEKYSVKLSDYWDLHEWSTENIDKFWEEIWHLAGVVHSKTYHQVIDLSVPMSEFQEWFAGAKMNYAENLLKYRDDHVALVVAGEDKETEIMTYAEMYEEAKLYAAALRKIGIKKGDVVTCFMSNRKEAIVAMIAATSIGALWAGALPLSGSQAVLSRFKQVNPVVLFTVDRFPHNKEEINMLPKLKDIANGLPSLQKVIIVASKPESKFKDISEIRNSCFLEEFLQNGKDENGSVPEMVFEQVDFTHPVFISYTSGTTGLPKVLVHSSGILLAVYKDFFLQNDSSRNVCWFSMSPVGWGTWSMFASMLFLGLKLVIFEGFPYFLSPTFFWDMVESLEITHLLIVTSVLDDMQKKGCVPREGSRPVKFVMSGGTVVKPENYDFAYNKIKCEIFSSIYGSSECIGTSLFHDQTQKVFRGEIPGVALGIEIQCIDDTGKPAVGVVGDMVFSKPFPSLVQGIWGDDTRRLLKKAYYEKYPGKFYVGDLILINPVTKGIFVYGRCDETLNPRGCRFGSAEIYSVVDKFPEIRDSICVSHYNKNRDERAVLFLKMNEACFLDENLLGRLRTAITRELSARHVPEVILETKEIPAYNQLHAFMQLVIGHGYRPGRHLPSGEQYNMNGKKMESIVKKIINKMPYSPETVVNPDNLKNYIDLPQLGEFI